MSCFLYGTKYQGAKRFSRRDIQFSSAIILYRKVRGVFDILHKLNYNKTGLNSKIFFTFQSLVNSTKKFFRNVKNFEIFIRVNETSSNFSINNNHILKFPTTAWHHKLYNFHKNSIHREITTWKTKRPLILIYILQTHCLNKQFYVLGQMN